MSYAEDAKLDAKNAVSEYEDSIVRSLMKSRKPSKDLLRYEGGYAYHHERHVDKYYDAEDALRVLTELSEHEEKDSGLWSGDADFRRAMSTCAAYTYGNAVLAEFSKLIEEINSHASDIEEDDDEEDGGEEDKPSLKDRYRKIVWSVAS